MSLLCHPTARRRRSLARSGLGVVPINGERLGMLSSVRAGSVMLR
jgi:hypothetical protein